jgi:hypothetical protein
MMLVVILVSILAGFGAGYATRAWDIANAWNAIRSAGSTVPPRSGRAIHW